MVATAPCWRGEFLPEPKFVAYAVAGAAMLLFAGWLLYLSPRQRATRALSALLASIAAVFLLSFLADLPDPPAAALIAPASAVGLTGVGVSAIYFLCVYPRPRGWVGRSAWGGRIALLIVAFAAALFFAKPSLFFVAGGGPDGTTLPDNGPLAPVMSLWTVTTGLMLVLFALDAARTPPGPLRRSLLLVLCGFLTSGFVWSLSLLLNDVSGRLDPQAISATNGRLLYVIDESSFFLVLAAAAIVLGHALSSQHPVIRREGLAFALLLLVATAATGAATFLFDAPRPHEWTNNAQGVLDAAGGLSIPLFAGYALLKHRLFDIDVKLRWTISRGTVAAMFVGTFFVVSQVAQNFLEDSMGWALGGVIAGVMLFAIAPLQRAADRLAGAAVPAISPADRKLELYRLALAVALSDRAISREEERHLAKLAEQLGVTPTEALAAREAMEHELGLGM